MSTGPSSTSSRPGVVRPTSGALAARQPLGHDEVRLSEDGWLGAWQRLNREATLPHCLSELEETGTVDNLRRKTGEFDGPRRGLWFSDSDIYKTLEGIGWELDGDTDLRAAYTSLVELIGKAQDDDGYIHSWFGLDGKERWSNLTTGHEMYCAGHLIQAAVAAARGGDDRLLDIAQRFADLLVQRFGRDGGPGGGTSEGGRAAIDGHPEIETALVELWRQTGSRSYLELATRMIELRGHGTLGADRFGSSYFLDHIPVRQANVATGHAVRQLYLLAGATDVAVENGDTELLTAVERLWDDAFGTKTYLTGGHGSRHRDEAFGDAYELPSDRAYNETCAAIASFMWNWRLLLATGRRRYADEMERTLYNAVAVGLADDGTHFFYSNPLQLREGHDGSDEDSPSTRLPWYRCACCPPNLGRLGASLHHYVATGYGDAVQLHLIAAGRVRVELTAGPVELEVATDYPWDGRVTVTVVESPDGPWELSVRRPGWCEHVAVVGADLVEDRDGYLSARRAWRAGETVTIDLEMPVRKVTAHPAVDAVRGSLALQRGPLVYCVEGSAQADRFSVDQLSVAEDEAVDVVSEPDGTVSLTGTGYVRGAQVSLYQAAAAGDGEGAERKVTWKAGAYHRWANGEITPMRVWLPVHAAS
jgi:uncharacterized protein